MRSLFKINSNFLEKFIIRCALLMIFFILLSVCSAVFGIHSAFLILSPYLIGFVALYLLLLVIVNITELVKDYKQNSVTYVFLVFILLYCIWNAFFFFESKIEGGHDQGVYLETAANLANTGSLYIESNIALTYPGFWIYQSGGILSQFLPGYPAYLAPFYHLFGLNGFPIANAILLFLSIATLLYIGKSLRSASTGIIVAILFAFSYYTLYFSRACYVENLHLFLIWTSVYLFVKGYKKNKIDFMLLSGIPVALITLVRTEGFLYLVVYVCLLLYFVIRKRLQVDKNEHLIIGVTLTLITVAAYFVYVYSYNSDIVRDAFGGIATFFSTPMETATLPTASYNEQVFIWNYMFQVFNPILIPIMLFFGLVNILRDKPIRKEVFLILLLIIPQFIFLIKPSIAFYLPWYMRRFWPVFLPFTIILFSLFLTNAKFTFGKYGRYVLVLISIVFLTIFLSQSAGIMFFSEGKGIATFEQRVAAEFGNDDLVIFWDRYHYENYGPPLYFLFGINVVFDRSPAFTPELYAMYLKDYDNVYIASSRGPTGSLAHPYFNDSDVEYIKSIEADDSIMISAQCEVREYIINPDNFKGYYQFDEKCQNNNPPTEWSDYYININIYELNKETKDLFIEQYYDPNYELQIYELKGEYSNKFDLDLN